MSSSDDAILALDLARRTGWAHGIIGARPTNGMVHLSNVIRGGVFSGFTDWLNDTLDVSPARTIICEAPIVRVTGPRSEDPFLIAIGLFSLAEECAYRRSLRFHKVHASTARKSVLGRGTFRRGEAKGEVASWCRTMRFTPVDDNAADAIVLWHYAEAQMRQRRMIEHVDALPFRAAE